MQTPQAVLDALGVLDTAKDSDNAAQMTVGATATALVSATTDASNATAAEVITGTALSAAKSQAHAAIDANY